MSDTTTQRPSFPVYPTRPPPSIKVVINTPQIKIVEIGETTEFNCRGYYLINNVSNLILNYFPIELLFYFKI